MNFDMKFSIIYFGLLMEFSLPIHIGSKIPISGIFGNQNEQTKNIRRIN